jgi:hypothetical protein
MAATVQISESNGAGETPTDNVSNINMGSTDAANLVAATYPITAGTYSYEKYNRVKLVSLGGSTKIKNIKVWRTGDSLGSDTHKTCARESSYTEKNYATPVNTVSSQATETMPTSEPSGANLGIDGSLTGELDADSEYSDYLVHQIYVDAATTAGKSCTLNFKYEEIA